MKVKDFIETMKKFNKEAELVVIAHNKGYKFSISFGGGEGCTIKNCSEVFIDVDNLNSSESEQKTRSKDE